MPATYSELIAFLNGLNTGDVEHTDGSLLAHLIKVDRDLQTWGCDEAVCRAGMFHSIYGTEKFQKFSLPLTERERVRRLIGERAERLAYLNCVMDRTAFDGEVERGVGPYRLVDRLTQQPIDVTDAEFDDLCRVHLCDWLEQVPRCRQWDYRRAAYERLAARLGGVAQEAFDDVYNAAAT